MCSEPGQQLIKKDIEEHGLDRVVVAACSPRMHEITFRKALRSAGLNPYCLEIANIREHCSWVHEDRMKATQKAQKLLAAAVSKAALLEPLEEKEVGVTPAALVVREGSPEFRQALNIGDAGYKVYLVEKEPSIGGHMIQLDKTFPTLDCSACILTPKMADVGNHPNIELLSYSEVVDVRGFVGNFEVTIEGNLATLTRQSAMPAGNVRNTVPLKSLTLLIWTCPRGNASTSHFPSQCQRATSLIRNTSAIF